MDFDSLAQKWDSKKVFLHLKNFSVLLKEAYLEAKKKKTAKKRFSKVLICGMGGSAIMGFVLKDLLKSESKIPIEVENSYSFPAWIDSKTLVILVSYSGKTEETLACLQQAKKQKAFLVGISANPDFEKKVREFYLAPNYFSTTRFAFPALFSCLLAVLEKKGIVKNQKAMLLGASAFLEKENSAMEEAAKSLAERLQGKTPLFIAPHYLKSTALKWTQDWNENAKSFAFFSYLSELNHNQINAVQGLQNAVLVFWRTTKEDPKTRARMELTQQIFGEHLETIEIEIKGNSLLEQALYAASLGAFTSYFLGLLNGVDPEPVPGNERLKRELAKIP